MTSEQVSTRMMDIDFSAFDAEEHYDSHYNRHLAGIAEGRLPKRPRTYGTWCEDCRGAGSWVDWKGSPAFSYRVVCSKCEGRGGFGVNPLLPIEMAAFNNAHKLWTRLREYLAVRWWQVWKQAWWRCPQDPEFNSVLKAYSATRLANARWWQVWLRWWRPPPP